MTGKCWKIRNRTSLISHSGVRSTSLSSRVSSQYFFTTRRTSNSSIWRFDFSYVPASTSITLNCRMGILDDDQILRLSFLTDSTDFPNEILRTVSNEGEERHTSEIRFPISSSDRNLELLHVGVIAIVRKDSQSSGRKLCLGNNSDARELHIDLVPLKFIPRGLLVGRTTIRDRSFINPTRPNTAIE